MKTENYNDDSVAELFAQLISVTDALTKLAEFELRKHRLTMVQARILYILIKEDRALTQNELSLMLRRKFNSVSTLIQRMVNKGLVEKIKNTTERQFYIHITPKGIDLNRKFRTNGVLEVLLQLSLDERTRLSTILMKLFDRTRQSLWEKWKDNTPFVI